jgi:hypothetical protein
MSFLYKVGSFFVHNYLNNLGQFEYISRMIENYLNTK